MLIGLDNKVSLKQRQQPKIAAHSNSPLAYIREGLLSELYGMLSSRERRNKPCKDRKKFSSFIVAALVSNRHCFNPNSKKTMQLLPVSS